MLSIITINKNDREGLERSIASVLMQESSDYEYLIVDGASTDGSIDAIAASAEGIDWWVSEPDSGIYNAMNKGIRKARGDYCLFLNSGDCLIGKDAVARINEATASGADVLFSDAILSENGRDRLSRYPRNVTVGYFLINTLNHQNTVIKRALLNEQGLYREDFKIASDWFLFFKASAEKNISYEHLPFPLVRYGNDGISSSPAGSARNEAERKAGISEVFAGMMPVAEELKGYQDSVYGSIIRRFGHSKGLDFLLRAYRILARVGSKR